MIYGPDDWDRMPRGHYGAVYADPAWNFVKRSDKPTNKVRHAAAHYPTMSLAEIKALPVGEIARKDALLFMWTTSPHLLESLEVMKAWGFKYSTLVFVWAKTLRRYDGQPGLFYDTVSDFHAGTGYTTQANAEYVILGRRGRPPKRAAVLRQLIVAPRREHSRKPDEARDRLAKYVGDVPKIELNARQEVLGWDQWGNEVQKFPRIGRQVRRLPSWGRV